LGEEPMISEELESLLNVELGPEIYEIEKGMVRKFAEAIEDPNPLWQKIAPPTFPAALIPKELFHKLLAAKCPLSRSLNGASELEYYQPINVGDVITCFSPSSQNSTSALKSAIFWGLPPRKPSIWSKSCS